jgi:translocator protein
VHCFLLPKLWSLPQPFTCLQKVPLSIYAAQLAFNFAWQPIFFIARRLDYAVVDCSLLLASTVATTAAFAKVNKNAACLLAPNVLWVAYACALNANILKRNPKAHRIKLDDKDE